MTSVSSRTVIGVLLVTGAVLLGGWLAGNRVLRGVGSDSPAAGIAAPVSVREVDVAVVEERNVERVVDAVGAMYPLEEVTLRVKVAGRLGEVRVDLGDRVGQGEVVALVEQEDYELEVQRARAQVGQGLARLGMVEGDATPDDLEQMSLVRQAQATLHEARRNLQRLNQLSQPGIVSEADLDAAELAVELAEGKLEDALQEARHRVATLAEQRATLAIAEQRLGETILRAPFDGAITLRAADAGEYLNVGDAVLSLVRTDAMRLRLEISERLAPQIALGQKVRFQLGPEGESYQATVDRLSPVIEPGSRILIVESRVSAREGLRPGSFVRGQIVVESAAPAVTVAASAVVSFAGVHRVFVVQDGRAVEREVTLGQRADGWVELSGVAPGDVVVLDPGNLRGGTEVKIVAPVPAAMAAVDER